MFYTDYSYIIIRFLPLKISFPVETITGKNISSVCIKSQTNFYFGREPVPLIFAACVKQSTTRFATSSHAKKKEKKMRH